MKTLSHSLSHAPYARRWFSPFIGSFLLTLLVIAVLWPLLQTLGESPELLAGRNDVYKRILFDVSTDTAFSAKEQQREQWLYWLLANPLAALLACVLTPMLWLWAGATAMPRIGWLCLGLALFGASAASLIWLTDFSFTLDILDQTIEWGFWTLAALSLIAWPLLVRKLKSLSPTGKLRGLRLLGLPVSQSLSVWAFPAFVLLSGLGLIWLLDYSARGHFKFRWLGVDHAWAWYVALWLYAAASGLRDLVMRSMAWLLSRTSRAYPAHRAWRWGLGLLFLLYVVSVCYLGFTNPKRHALTSELLRLPLYIATAWVLYRFAPSWSRKVRLVVLVGLSAVWIILVLLSKDSGPALVWIYSSVLMLAVVWRIPQLPSLARQDKAAAKPSNTLGAMAAVGLLLLMLLVHGIVVRYGNVTVSTELRTQTMQEMTATGVDSLQARTEIYKTLRVDQPVLPYDFLLRLHWFMQAAVQHDAPLSWFTGYGLGQTPWCSYAGNIGADCDGLPLQTQSDYALAGLMGAYGPVFTVLAIGLLVALMFRPLYPSQRLTSTQSLQPVDPRHLGRWLGVVFACTMLIQIFVSLLGTIGLSTMTGVTLPLLAFGSSALWSCALFLGLCGSAQLGQQKNNSSSV